MSNDRIIDSLEGSTTHWSRMYLGKYHKTGEPLDGLGHPDYRYLRSLWMYNPLEFRPWQLMFEPPPVGGPAGQNWVTLTELMEDGLDFYVYLAVQSLRVTYDRIKAEDEFYLFSLCETLNIELPCEVVDPRNSRVARHQHAFPRALTNELKKHQMNNTITGGWSPGKGHTNAIDLPIFLRVQPDHFREVFRDLEDRQLKVSTFNLGLRHTFPRAEKFTQITMDGATYIKVGGDESRFSHQIDNFLTVQRELPTTVRILVASDLHVADRNDTLENPSENLGNPNDSSYPYCNFNRQVKKLADDARNLWEAGKLDCVVLMGDLIDFAVKDKHDLEINMYLNRGFAQKENTEGVEKGIPYALGEFGLELPELLGQSVIVEDDWNEFVEESVDIETTDYVPEGRTLFIDKNGSDPGNLGRVVKVERKLHESTEYPEFNNWSILQKILAPILHCFPTYLVPGNHDRLILGTELLGVSEEHYKAFIDEVVLNALQDDPDWLPSLFSAGLHLATSGDEDAMIRIARSTQNLPPWQENEFYKKYGLSKTQAENYDRYHRGLHSTRIPPHDYRSMLAVFHSPSALTGLSGAGGFYLTGELGVAPCEINYKWDNNTKRIIRLAFFDTGPDYDILRDQSPCSRGFYVADSKKVHPAISSFKQWRDGAEFQNDTLIAFMHAPPVSHYGGHGGDTIQERQLLSFEGTILKEKYPMTFNYGWRQFLSIFHPYYTSTNESWNAKRTNPILVFAGHTHRRHTYCVPGSASNPPFDYKYYYGNALLDELKKVGLPPEQGGQGFQGSYDWWFNPEINLCPDQMTGRAMCVHVGCVGPIPSHDYDEAERTPIERDQEGFTSLKDKQGYYIVEITKGVVTKMEWHSLWYADE